MREKEIDRFRGKYVDSKNVGLIPDRVVGSQADPVRDRPILPHLLRELLLDSESLVRRLWIGKEEKIELQTRRSSNIH